MSIEKVLEAHTVQDMANFNELKAEVKALRADIQVIQQQLGAYKGALGGALFVITAFWAFITWGLTWLRG